MSHQILVMLLYKLNTNHNHQKNKKLKITPITNLDTFHERQTTDHKLLPLLVPEELFRSLFLRAPQKLLIFFRAPQELLIFFRAPQELLIFFRALQELPNPN